MTIDLSRLMTHDVPPISRHPVGPHAPGRYFYLRGGKSHPSWGDDGPELYLIRYEAGEDDKPNATQTMRLPWCSTSDLAAPLSSR